MMIELWFALAEIPIFDLKGIDFLWFYGISLIGVSLWALGRKARIRSKFSFPGAADRNLTDPYEAAFLAGGVVRCSQVAIMRLLEMNALRISEHPTDKVLWVTGQNAEESWMNPMEWALYQRVEKTGDKGLPISNAVAICKDYGRSVEASLAKSGLRPTDLERKYVGVSSVYPVLFLAIIGVAKIFIGLTRDKPIGFLIIALVLTFVIAIKIARSTKPLTADGERVLKRMKSEQSTASVGGITDLTQMSFALAILGPTGLPGTDYVSLIEMDRANALASKSSIWSDSSSGCSSDSSGCGSSGCSSGCGGCGGGD